MSTVSSHSQRHTRVKMTGPQRGCDRESSRRPMGFGSVQGVSDPGVSDHLRQSHQGLVFKTWIRRPQLSAQICRTRIPGDGPLDPALDCDLRVMLGLAADRGPLARKDARSPQPCNLTKPGQVLGPPLPLPPLPPAWKFLTSVLFSDGPVLGNHCLDPDPDPDPDPDTVLLWARRENSLQRFHRMELGSLAHSQKHCACVQLCVCACACVRVCVCVCDSA
ncbi:hypothetical protein HJG60_008804 [Phyllostomus discolor]|uniref:Uncharacterized protein n=1 Tax=Phyllostomus discolor TaxID=89673 RepID=A0A833YZ16_9CHIR|nr:hypothetical protein HJG60_008804 [Phyllostomus discolor]